MQGRYKVGVGVVVAAAIAGAVAGLALATQSDRTQPIAYVPTTPSSTKPETPQAALAGVLARAGATRVTRAEIGTPPPGVARSGPWLSADVSIPSLQDGLDIEPMWEADLVQGAVAEAIGTSPDLHSDFAGSTFNVVLPDGTVVPDQSGGMGDVARGQEFDSSTTPDVEHSIRTGLANLGWKPVSISVLHADGPAPAVIAQVPDPVAATENLMQEQATLFGPTRYEGFYLELRDLAGNAFLRTSAAFRVGDGRSWVAPAYQDDSPIKSGGRPPIHRRPSSK